MLKMHEKIFWSAYGSANKIVKQIIDLALLANNMLRGEELSTFVQEKRGAALGKSSWLMAHGS